MSERSNLIRYIFPLNAFKIKKSYLDIFIEAFNSMLNVADFRKCVEKAKPKIKHIIFVDLKTNLIDFWKTNLFLKA